jgi:hypothetical protein
MQEFEEVLPLARCAGCVRKEILLYIQYLITCILLFVLTLIGIYTFNNWIITLLFVIGQSLILIMGSLIKKTLILLHLKMHELLSLVLVGIIGSLYLYIYISVYNNHKHVELRTDCFTFIKLNNVTNNIDCFTISSSCFDKFKFFIINKIINHNSNFTCIH